jgi:hypothetical protein
MVSFMLWYFLCRERASVDMLNTRLNIYHVNQKTNLGHGMLLFYFQFSGPKAMFIRLFIFNNFSSFTYTSIFHSHNGIHCESEGSPRLCFMH